MLSEFARWRKLPKLMSDHVFSDENRDVAFAVVYTEGQSDHVRRDRRATRPSLDRLRLCSAVQDLFKNFLNAEIDERSFF